MTTKCITVKPLPFTLTSLLSHKGKDHPSRSALPLRPSKLLQEGWVFFTVLLLKRSATAYKVTPSAALHSGFGKESLSKEGVVSEEM